MIAVLSIWTAVKPFFLYHRARRSSPVDVYSLSRLRSSTVVIGSLAEDVNPPDVGPVQRLVAFRLQPLLEPRAELFQHSIGFRVRLEEHRQAEHVEGIVQVRQRDGGELRGVQLSKVRPHVAQQALFALIATGQDRVGHTAVGSRLPALAHLVQRLHIDRVLRRDRADFDRPLRGERMRGEETCSDSDGGSNARRHLSSSLSDRNSASR